jgi:hypothetical protein
MESEPWVMTPRFSFIRFLLKLQNDCISIGGAQIGYLIPRELAKV